MLNQFKNLSCYEEFEIQVALTGISKTDVLNNIGHWIDNYYFFVLDDGIFNWFDLSGNHVEDPGVLKELKNYHIPDNITKCIIPNSVISIGAKAFCYCESLTSITMHNNITNIGDYAFYFCDSLKEITIPDNVTSIGDAAFYSCESLISITIPDDVTSIGIKAFYDCVSLKEVIFKGKTLNEVKQMKNYPFGIKDKSIIKCEI